MGPLKGRKKGRGKRPHINNFPIRASCTLMCLNRLNLSKEEVIAKYSSPTKNLEPISLLEHQIIIANSPKPEYLITLLSHWWTASNFRKGVLGFNFQASSAYCRHPTSPTAISSCLIFFFLWVSGNCNVLS